MQEKYDYEKDAAAGLNEVRDWCVWHFSRIAIVLKNFVVHRPLSLRETALLEGCSAGYNGALAAGSQSTGTGCVGQVRGGPRPLTSA